MKADELIISSHKVTKLLEEIEEHKENLGREWRKILADALKELEEGDLFIEVGKAKRYRAIQKIEDLKARLTRIPTGT